MAVSTHRVNWTDVAYHDLESIIDFIANESVINARKVLTRIEDKAEGLTCFPNRGRIVPELKWHGVTRYREVVVKSWRLVYRIDRKEIWVVAVLDSRRQLEDVLLERFLYQ